MNELTDFRNEKEKEYDFTNHLTFKYTLECNICLWKSSFYEVSGSIYLDSQKVSCPLCHNRQIIWQKTQVKNTP